MTAPVVAQVAVEVVASAAALAKSLRKEVEAAFKDLDLSKLIRESVGNTKIKLPVEPDFDPDGLGEKVRRTRVPKIPVEVDPLTSAFIADVKRSTAALAKEVNVKVPVDGDTTGLREDLGAQLKAISSRLKATVPVEPGDKAQFQADLRAQLAEVSARLKAHIGVEPDVAGIPAKVRQVRIPPVKVDVDPVLAAFQAQVRAETAALARSVNTKIPFGADTVGLRAKLSADLAAIQHQLKATVPTEPGSKAVYEAKLKAQLAEVSARVKQHVDVDTSKGIPGLGALGGALKGVGSILPNIAGVIPFIGKVASGLAEIGGAAQKAAGSSAQLGGDLAGGAEAATGPVGILIAALVTAAAAVAALVSSLTTVTVAVPAIATVAGALAAIPGALAGLGAAGGTLALGFHGISEAFAPKKPGSGGGAAGSAAQQARQVAAASRQIEAARRGIDAANRSLASSERGLLDAQSAQVQAQQRLGLAQQAVNKARVEAAKDVDDLNRSLRGAKLSEEDAALSVTDALRALNTVKLTGNIPDIQRADLAYREALQTLDEAKATTADLSQKTADANKKGVEGSDKVKSALRDQVDAVDAVRKAHEGVLDAQNAVLSAQDGVKSAADGLKSAEDSLAQAQQKTAAGAAAAAAKIIPLAKSAQKFVDTIKALKPAFETLRLDVQQRLFAGLDQTVTLMWGRWKDQLHTTLGSFADAFNGFFRNLGSAVAKPKFISDIAVGAEGVRSGLIAIGSAITAKLVPAFGALSRAAGPFLKAVGDEIAQIVTDFSNWVLRAQKSGKLTDFFDRATKAMHSIFTTGKDVVKIIGDLFTIITGSQQRTGKTGIDALNDALESLHKWLQNPEHQQAIKDFINKLIDGFKSAKEGIDKFVKLLDLLGLGNDKKKGSTQGARDVGEDIGKALFAGLLFGLTEAFKLQMKLILAPYKGMINDVKAVFGIKSPSTVFADIGHDLIAGLLKGITDKFKSLGDKVGQIRTTVTNNLSDAGSWLYNHGRDAVTGLGNGIASLAGNLRVRAAGLRTSVGNAFSNAGSLLYNAGRNIINGLMNGIGSLVGNLGSYLGEIGTFIQNHKGPPEKDRVLLYGAGRLIMGGLIAGIADQKTTLAAELSDVTSIVAGTSLPSLGAAADVALSSSLSVADQQTLQVAWKNGASADPVLRAFQNLISVQFNGDVQAAFSRG